MSNLLFDTDFFIEAYLNWGAVAIGRGEKRTGGKPTGKEAIIVNVPQKFHPMKLSKNQLVPKRLDGNLLDVNPVGILKAPQPVLDVFPQSNTEKERPFRCGGSIGHKDITAGTGGCIVRRNGVKFILSNNHVLANSNAGEIGDAIYQPGPYDDGTEEDKIGELHDFIPIHFMGEETGCLATKAAAATLRGPANVWNRGAKKGKRKSRIEVRAIVPQADFNLVDCATCLPTSVDLISEEIIDIGSIEGIWPAELGTAIKKSGRTTGLTTGEIQQVDVTANVQYGAGQIAVFTDQLLAGAMSQGGDSGSAVVTTDNLLTGLLFAGSDSTTIINRIENVFSALKISI
jgi:hypothetical protein